MSKRQDNRKTITGLPPNYSARQVVFSDFVPGIDASYILGDTTQRWKWIYTVGATVYNTLVVGGTLQSKNIEAFGDIQVRTDPFTSTGGNVVCDETVSCKRLTTTQNITCGGNFSAVGSVASATAAIVGLLSSGSLGTGSITCSTVAATGALTAASLAVSGTVTANTVLLNSISYGAPFPYFIAIAPVISSTLNSLQNVTFLDIVAQSNPACFNGTTGTFTATVTGLYQFEFRLSVNAASGMTSFVMWLTRSTGGSLRIFDRKPLAAGIQMFTASTTQRFSAGETIRFATVISGAALITAYPEYGNSSFHGRLIG
jgi:hypothetical protein